MAVTNPEILTEPLNYNKSLVVSNYESLSPKLRQEWELLRRTYMDEHMDWHVADDSDLYDADPATLQLLLLNSSGNISAGMRLTPCLSIQDTLSWTMLQGITDEHARDIDGPVWDLTRLVPGDAMDKSDILPAFAELFGAALAQTQTQGGNVDNPRWVFATHPGFVNAFKRYGIEFTIIPGTERDSGVLCHALPVERTQFLVDHQAYFSDAYTSVARGIQRVSPDWDM